MTEEQFNEIKERLTRWREDRKLPCENQKEAFLGNVFEKVSEYFRAGNDLERINILYDIIVFCFNIFSMDYNFYRRYSSKLMSTQIDIVIESICFLSTKFKSVEVPDDRIALTMSRCFNLAYSLGFDFYGCMLEKVKEVESRSGYYDFRINKFIKDKGAYTKEEVEILYNKKGKIKIEEFDDEFLIWDKKSGAILDHYSKWYRPDYSKHYIRGLNG